MERATACASCIAMSSPPSRTGMEQGRGSEGAVACDGRGEAMRGDGTGLEAEGEAVLESKSG